MSNPIARMVTQGVRQRRWAYFDSKYNPRRVVPDPQGLGNLVIDLTPEAPKRPDGFADVGRPYNPADWV